MRKRPWTIMVWVDMGDIKRVLVQVILERQCATRKLPQHVAVNWVIEPWVGQKSKPAIRYNLQTGVADVAYLQCGIPYGICGVEY